MMTARSRLSVIALAALLAGAACTSDDDTGDTGSGESTSAGSTASGSPEPDATQAPPDDGGGGGSDSSVEATPSPSPAPATDSPATDPPATDPPPLTDPPQATETVSLPPLSGDVGLYTLPECDVVPGGALSGADVLNLLVAVRNGGPGEVVGPVEVNIRSDSGVDDVVTTGISTGSTFSALQVDLASGDYNRSHRFTITADPNDLIREPDESNNSIQITVNLQAQPTAAGLVPCTSP